MTEEWRPVVGYEGRYMVSSLGRVRSLPSRLQGKVMNPSSKERGYRYVTLCVDGVRRNHYVHRLVAEAFCPRMEGQDVVRHKDDVTDDNRAENLEWGTTQDNVNDCIERGRHWVVKKTHCVKGHEFTPENTGRRKDRPNRRICRECARAVGRQIYYRKKAAA